MKKSIIISISMIVVATIIAGVVLIKGGMFTSYDKHIELAYKYLQEGRYEEAILEFDKAIEINDKKAEAYIGKAETYITRGDDNAANDAAETLKLAYGKNNANKDKVIDATTKFTEKLIDKDKHKMAYDIVSDVNKVISDSKIDDDLLKIAIDYIEGNDNPDSDFFKNLVDEIVDTTKRDDFINWWNDYKNENQDKLDPDIIDGIDKIIGIDEDNDDKNVVDEGNDEEKAKKEQEEQQKKEEEEKKKKEQEEQQKKEEEEKKKKEQEEQQKKEEEEKKKKEQEEQQKKEEEERKKKEQEKQENKKQEDKNEEIMTEEAAMQIVKDYWDYEEPEAGAELVTMESTTVIALTSDREDCYKFALKWWVEDHWSTIDIIYVNKVTGDCTV